MEKITQPRIALYSEYTEYFDGLGFEFKVSRADESRFVVRGCEKI